jgi:hypothetical protein
MDEIIGEYEMKCACTPLVIMMIHPIGACEAMIRLNAAEVPSPNPSHDREIALTITTIIFGPPLAGTKAAVPSILQIGQVNLL